MSRDYQKLDKSIVHWINKQGWESLRQVQNEAIDPIMQGGTDVIISASTAAGKTEAFFLPAISSVVKARNDATKKQSGIEILYISPLKALINDQYRRLESMSEVTGVEITAWHGDSSQSAKKNLRKKPSGILLITPESLEAMLLNNMSWAASAFRNLKYVVIDEFHAFLGTERGQHLISLLTRIEYVSGRIDTPAPRVALSATLGDIESVPALLRPSQTLPCKIIKESGKKSNIRVLIRSFCQPNDENKDNDEKNAVSEAAIAHDLYEFCRGGNNLVFSNSRSNVEMISARLSDMCKTNIVPNEFFPHHGSLSKEHREILEKRLQRDEICTTAICTMTLELGIDIGKVDAVVQVGTPHTVASLRQRLGRSGRRGGGATLKMINVEREIENKTEIDHCLRLSLVQSIAMIRLLLVDNWFEPADSKLPHLSALLHQILATIGQYGGIRAGQLYELLCTKGAFHNIKSSDFIALLRAMRESDLITQMSDNQLALGLAGEAIVSHYTFYAVFQTPEEYRVLYGHITIGQIPVSSMLTQGQYILFAGKRWQVRNVNDQNKTIDVVMASGGGAPPVFSGGLGDIHERISQEMYAIYRDGDYKIRSGEKSIDFIDKTARSLFMEGYTTFEEQALSTEFLTMHKESLYVFLWMGTKVASTLKQALELKGIESENLHHMLSIKNNDIGITYAALKEISDEELPTAYELAQSVLNKQSEKYDEYIPNELLDIGIAAKFFDVDGLRRWFDKINL